MSEPVSEIQNLKIRLLETQKIFAIVKYLNKVGHESNNQISTISAGLQLSKSRIQTEESLSKIIERSIDCSNKIAKTFKNFQLFKQFNKLQKSPFLISTVIKEATELLTCKYPGKNLVFDVKFENEADQIEADYSQLLQVFFHAIENSIEATKGDVAINITVKPESRDSKQGLLVMIQDHGRGMPEIISNQLFQLFATTKMSFGSGLGLFLIHSIVTEHGGEVTVESGESGTKLFLFLPVK